MNCKDIEALIPAYVLDALSAEEEQAVEQHMDGCSWCSGQARIQRDVAAVLSLGVEQRPPPRRVLAGVKRRIAEAEAPPVPERPPSRFRRRPLSLIGAFVYAGALMALLLLGGVLAFTLRTSGQMDNLQETNSALTQQVSDLQQDNSALSNELSRIMDHNSEMGERVSKLHENSSEVTADMDELVSGREVLHEQVDALAVSGREMMTVLRTQQSIVYMLTLPDTHVLTMESDSGAVQGNLMMNMDRHWCVFVATGLHPLPHSLQYNVWLRRGQNEYHVAVLSIDELGWGQVMISPEMAMAEYQWVGVTVEQTTAAGPQGRRGDLVLWGEIHLANPLYPGFPRAGSQ
jgi:hypothetical protein